MAKVSLRHYTREIETMIDRGQLDEAVAHGQHILKTFPKHLETYRLLGKAFLEYKRHDDAADIFMRVLAAEPNDFVANVGMSIIRDEENKLDDAIWHMERAFEVQPSNPAIQSELQRLYGRRDGVQPPRIRMTRGALAHMYVQGELYPQAISEIKSVLKDDLGRSDMQVLLARAYFKSGQKNDAAEAANSVLRRYPYCLDANRVLVEILGVDRPENAQAYRQRVVELDPYASQVTGTIFQTDEVGDNAVTLETLNWNGQRAQSQADWRSAQGLALESERGAQEPDWLNSGFAQSTPPPPPKPTVVPPVQASASVSNEPAAQLTPEEEIPEFLRAAGWGASTGAFDESQSSFEEELAATPVSNEPIEQGDLPDWVKEMMPQEASKPPAQVAATEPAAQEEELPDWIKNIGTGALSASAAASTPDWLGEESTEAASSIPAAQQPDWMQGIEQSAETSSASLAADDSLDWLGGLGEPATEQPAASDSQPDWMKGFEQPAETSASSTDDSMDWLSGLGQSAASDGQSDWLKGIDQPADTASASAPADDSLDWLKGMDQPASEQLASSEAQPDWLSSFSDSEPEPSNAQPAQTTDEFDWLKDVGSEPEASLPETESANVLPSSAQAEDEFDFLRDVSEMPTERVVYVPPVPSLDADSLGKSDQERDDSFAWLEALAAKQGASEGLLTKPEERLQDEPDWVKQAKGQASEAPASQAPAQEPPAQPAPSSANVADLGKSQTEIDDSLAWLENLAAKQGATEGLLTKPEERLQDEPDWVKQVKATPQEPVQPTPAPASNVADLGKSQQEIDDSLAWLENLAAKQGATEGLLTKPEERLEQEPDWVTQAKSAPQEPVQPAQTPAANVADLGKSQAEIDDSLAWLENLAAKQGATEGLLTKPEERLQDEPDWVKQVKSAPQEPSQPTPAPTANVADLGKSQAEIDDSLAWLENLAAKQGATEGLLTKPEERLQDEPDWVKQVKATPQEPELPQPVTEESVSATDDTLAWLGSLDEEEPEQESGKDDTSMWLKSLDVPTPASELEKTDDMPMWLQGLEAEESKPVPAASDATSMWLKGLEAPQSEMTSPAEDQTTAEVPAWLQGLEEETKTPEAEAVVPVAEAGGEFDWLNEIEEQAATPSAPQVEEASLPAWLKGMDEEESRPGTGSLTALPGWMRDETGEVLAEPTKIEPTRSTDWRPAEVQQPEPVAHKPEVPEAPKPEVKAAAVVPQPVEPEQEKPRPAPRKAKSAPEPKPEPYREPVTMRGTGMLTMPVDPTLGSARNELSRSNIPGALDAYEKLIKKGRYLDEVIFDLREALDRFPVEVSILQALGDAYMRANRLQDALDAYTKAEELLR